MAQKRPSIFDEVEQPAPQAKAAKVVPIKAPKARADVQHTSVYIPRAAYERLREISFIERVSINELLMEGVEMVMSKRGHPEKARRAKA